MGPESEKRNEIPKRAVKLFGGERKLAQHIVNVVNAHPLPDETECFFDRDGDPVEQLANISRPELLDQFLARGINIEIAMPLDMNSIPVEERKFWEQKVSESSSGYFPPTTMDDLDRFEENLLPGRDEFGGSFE